MDGFRTMEGGRRTEREGKRGRDVGREGGRREKGERREEEKKGDREKEEERGRTL